MPEIGTVGCSFRGSTDLSLCKQVGLWEFACPPSYIFAPTRNIHSAQPGAGRDSIPKRSQTSGAVQHENAAARAAVEINESRAGRRVCKRLAARNLFCDEFGVARGRNRGSFFQYAGNSAGRASKRMALHGARSESGSDCGDGRKPGSGSPV